MRFARRIFFFALFAVPAILIAQAAYTGPTYTDGSPRCSFDRAETIAFDAAQSNATGTIMGKNDKCVSETVSIDSSGKITFAPASSTRERIEAACTKRDNCVAPKCGWLTIKLLGDKTITINKCDKDAQRKIEDALAGGPGGTQGQAFRSTANVAVDRLNLNNPEDRRQTEQVLKSFGVTDTQAKYMTLNKPDETKDLLRAFASGDKSAIETAAAKAGVTLNSDVVNGAVSMTDTTRAKNMGAIFNENENRTFSSTVSGLTGGQGVGAMAGVTDMDKAKCAISQIESGSCGGNYGAKGPWTPKGDRAYGRYQVMGTNLPSWTRGACGRSLHPEEFLADGNCQEKVFEKYFGEAVARCGSYPGAASVWFSGKCQVTNAWDRYTTVGQYVNKFTSSFGNSAMPFGAQARPYLGGGSPFASVNPVGYDSYGYASSGYAPYQQLYQAPYTPVGTPYQGNTVAGGVTPTQPTQPVRTGTAPTPTVPQTPPPPVASIIAQPKEPKKGDPITISWATVGMKTDTPCQVTAGGSFLAQGNAGTRVFQTKTINASTTLLFELKCTSLAGKAMQEQVSLLLR